MDHLAPPSTTKTMSSPSSTASDSGHSSSNSSRSNSESPLINFTRPLDPSDPLSFFIDAGAADVLSASGSGGDSSAEDSFLTSPPPSAHDSPAGDWSGATYSKGDAPVSLWSQPDFSSYELEDFNSVNDMDFQLGFDPMLFSNDPHPLFTMDSTAGGAKPVPTELSSYAFNFGTDSFSGLQVPSIDASGRRLSVASSSSSSGLSSSPVSEHAQAVTAPAASEPSQMAAQTTAQSTDQAQMSNDQLMNELAARARQIVGMTMAMPMGSNIPAQQLQSLNATPSAYNTSAPSISPATMQAEALPPAPAPISTNARPKTSHTTIERRYRTNLNARIQSLRAAVPALRVLEVKAGNRVGNLSLKAGTRRVGVDPDAEAGEEDVIDERGYIDGVKVARKGSKANVLGKAVEYIRVLKRREMRLKREQDGLKALMRSLVGGPELVQQWETMWRERFGGPEKDEVDGEDGEADDENEEGDEDEDADDNENESASSSGKKRKRVKVEPSVSTVKAKGKKAMGTIAEQKAPSYSQAAPIIPSQYSNPMDILSVPIPTQPEKRKRGRPRKVPVPPSAEAGNMMTTFTPFSTLQFMQRQTPIDAVPASGDSRMEVDPTLMTQQQQQQQQLQAQPQQQPAPQYLLAAFAFFSFFNSPMSFTSKSGAPHAPYAHTHSGSVLGDTHLDASAAGWSPPPPTTVLSFGWRDVVQLTHLTVSVLLLLSILAPWVPRLARYIPQPLKPIMGLSSVPVTPAPAPIAKTGSDDTYASEEEKADASARSVLLSALRKGRSLAPAGEAQLLREALGLGTGVLGLVSSLTRQMRCLGTRRSRYGLERRMLEQKAFLKFAGLVALDANASLTTRIQTYLYASKFLSVFSASANDIATLALVIQPIWRAKAASLWALALNRAQGKGTSSPHISRAYETFVLESMTVDEAAHSVSRLDRKSPIVKSPESSDGESDPDDEIAFNGPVGPLAVLAKQAVREFIRSHAERVFLQTVPDDDEDERAFQTGDCDNSDSEAAERQMRRVVAAGCSLDARTAVLADMFEQVCNPTSARFTSDAALDTDDMSESPPSTSEDGDIELRDLLRAVVLYRRIFPSTLLSVDAGAGVEAGRQASRSNISISLTPMPSPPPSPSKRNAALHLSLRRCLDSAAFDRGDSLEDARDRVVDMLTAESSAWPKRLQY